MLALPDNRMPSWFARFNLIILFVAPLPKPLKVIRERIVVEYHLITTEMVQNISQAFEKSIVVLLHRSYKCKEYVG